MSGTDEVPMEVDSKEMDVDSGRVFVPGLQKQTQKPLQSRGTVQESPNVARIPEKRETASLSLYVKWLGDKPEQTSKQKIELERALQTWFNKKQKNTSCSVVKITNGGTVLIKIEPASAHDELFVEETELTWKDQKRFIVKAIPPSDPMTRASPPSAPHFTQVEGQGTAAAAAERDVSCTVPLFHFWYVSQAHRDSVERIQRNNGVEMVCSVKVSFVGRTGGGGGGSGGDPTKALEEFTDLAQSYSWNSITLPHEGPDRGDWEKALRVVRQDHARLLLMASSREATVCGPSQSLSDVQKYVRSTQSAPGNDRTPGGSSSRGLQDPSRREIRDPVVLSGLAIDKSNWAAMTTAAATQIADIARKFDVSFDYSTSLGKVLARAKATTWGAASLERHALRALLSLHQRVATSGMSRSVLSPNKDRTYEIERNLVLKEEDKQRMGHSPFSRSTDGGRGARGHEEEDNCAICLDQFTDKRRLKCGHEFCNKCLGRSMQSCGSFCPLCKEVFGKLIGNQPKGTMSWARGRVSLQGFENCGRIVISYNIPSGTQTKEHPKPGKSFYGASRTAYLPDNDEGNKLLKLLKTAFDQRLIFTVGTSRTSGSEDQVTWNDIHHKTSPHGGSAGFGYPDPDYLRRLREELKSKGIE